jgi:ribosomal protein S18 acetylase RimI-like enzyme
MMIALKLRKPISRDLDSMYAILEASIAPFLYVNENSSKENQLIIDKKYVKGYIEDKRFFTEIVEIDGTIVGWMAGSSNWEILKSHNCGIWDFYIEEIVVSDKHRRRGIGKKLLETIQCTTPGKIIVDTVSANLIAVRFYEKMGFAEPARATRDYSKNWKRMSRGCVGHSTGE